MKHRLAALLLLLTAATAGAGEDGWWEQRSPGQKALATELGVIGFIGAWGLVNWDYGENRWGTVDEGWFAADTRAGGADKAGHFYTGYLLGRSLAGLFRHYGMDPARAARRGALGSLAAMTFMEIGDGFSPYGLSWEDQAMNVAGAGLALLLEERPALASKLAVRGEYTFNRDSGDDILTDYEHWRYLVVLKLDGFAAMPAPLRWLELHAGYAARSDPDQPDLHRRYTHVGIGLSLTRAARALGWSRTAVFLDYYQPPGTVLRDERGF